MDVRRRTLFLQVCDVDDTVLLQVYTHHVLIIAGVVLQLPTAAATCRSSLRSRPTVLNVITPTFSRRSELLGGCTCPNSHPPAVSIEACMQRKGHAWHCDMAAAGHMAAISPVNQQAAQAMRTCMASGTRPARTGHSASLTPLGVLLGSIFLAEAAWYVLKTLLRCSLQRKLSK